MHVYDHHHHHSDRPHKLFDYNIMSTEYNWVTSLAHTVLQFSVYLICLDFNDGAVHIAHIAFYYTANYVHLLLCIDEANSYIHTCTCMPSAW